MAKYRAKEDLPPNVKAGDIVEVDGPLIPDFASRLELVTDETLEEKSPVTNPSRTELKERADKLGLSYASNIPTEKLMELVKEAEDEAKKEDGGEGGEDSGQKQE